MAAESVGLELCVRDKLPITPTGVVMDVDVDMFLDELLAGGQAHRGDVRLLPADLSPPLIVLTEDVSQPFYCSEVGIDVVSQLLIELKLMLMPIVARPTHKAGQARKQLQWSHGVVHFEHTLPSIFPLLLEEGKRGRGHTGLQTSFLEQGQLSFKQFPFPRRPPISPVEEDDSCFERLTWLQVIVEDKDSSTWPATCSQVREVLN